MRQVRFLTFCLMTVLLYSCNDLKLNDERETQEQGSLSLELSVDSGAVITRNGAGEQSQSDLDLDQFWVEIYKKASDGMESGLRLYRKQYAEAKNDLILLNAGDYYLRAKLGDSLGVGFTKPFYMAEEEFNLHPQTKEYITA